MLDLYGISYVTAHKYPFNLITTHMMVAYRLNVHKELLLLPKIFNIMLKINFGLVAIVVQLIGILAL
jgi:hypothetical protein